MTVRVPDYISKPEFVQGYPQYDPVAGGASHLTSTVITHDILRKTGANAAKYFARLGEFHISTPVVFSRK